MRHAVFSPLLMRVEIEHWPLLAPFRIAGHLFSALDVLVVSLEAREHVGRGEAAGVFYRNETPASMLNAVESRRATIESGMSRASLSQLLAPGGARNALDCALWDLESKVTGHAAWQIAGLEKPRPLLTTFTCGAAAPEEMASAACGYGHAKALKLKLTGEPLDAERVRAVRQARADVWLGVDANQSLTVESLEDLMPVLTEARVALIEQPFPIGMDALLDRVVSPIPIAADESAQSIADLPALAGRFDIVNIKLDKCGGLTEGLAMARAARAIGIEVMVGNMLGTSLAMAPAFILGQVCSVVDLDGPVFLERDRALQVQYAGGFVSCPEALWGGRGARQ